MTSNFYILDNSDIENSKIVAAKKLYNNGDYSGALKIYLDLISTSYSYKLYYEIGRCYYKLNDFEEAENNFMHSIALEHNKNSSFLFLGNLHSYKGNIAKAIEYWITYHSYKPDEAATCLNLANAYTKKNMRMQAEIYYKKYLKYSQKTDSKSYTDISTSVKENENLAKEFYKKAQRALAMKDSDTAIQALSYAIQNSPANFDANFLLGKLYYNRGEYLEASAYLKMAHCIDSRSLDTMEMLSTSLINVGDYTAAYCCLKRIIPLVLNNQSDYLEIIKAIKSIEKSIDAKSAVSHKEWGDKYYAENNYHFALFEYENCLIIDPSQQTNIPTLIEKLKRFVSPEKRIIQVCLEKGGMAYSNGDYIQSNKYFSKIITLSSPFASEYKLAKSRIINV